MRFEPEDPPFYACGMVSRVSSALGLCLALAACGGKAPEPVTPPEPAPVAGPAPASGPDPWAVRAPLAREELPAAPPSYPVTRRALPSPAGLAPPPAACRAFGRPASGGSCGERAAALEALSAALAETEAAQRDAELAALETCAVFPPGLVLALRAELAPVECGDRIVAAAIASPPPGVEGPAYDTLVGLGVAGMLARSVRQPPQLAPPHDKERVKKFIDEKLKAWITQQAGIIQQLSEVGATLKHYGQAVVAVEAGMADMRFIEAVRGVPVPEEFRKDKELEETYLDSLEDAFEPRKRRGRDAALVGLGRLATIGVIRDERVTRARELLSRMYGGSPIDALDALVMPPLAPSPPTTPEGKLAARLQAHYAGQLFPGEAARDDALLRQLVEKGLSLPHRIALANGVESPTARGLVARARLELGQNYWRAVDFDEALRPLVDWPTSTPMPEDVRLIFALGIALRGGPQNAAEMMEKAPIKALGIGRVEALDALADEGGALSGHAAFDAALIAQLAAPRDATADYWHKIAARYRVAADKLVDLPLKRDAEARASEADQVAAAIGAR
ncbi:MAG: hypothetical protein R3B72_35030 [Polyangiaceae bacterium]